MNNFVTNANALAVAGNKRNCRKNIKIKLIPINDDCLIHICELLDWVTWSNLCTAYPQLTMFNNGKNGKTLFLQAGVFLYEPIRRNEHLIREVIIEEGQLGHNNRQILDSYGHLKSIETLTVLSADHELDYIESTGIQYLTVTAMDHEGPLAEDFIAPLLEKSRKIKKLYYENGHFFPESSRSLAKNPIEGLTLTDVFIIDFEEFGNFLNGAIKLSHLAMMGSRSYQLQEYFWSTNNACKQRLKSITMTLLTRIEDEHLHRFDEFVNLESIRVYYTCEFKMEIFYGHITSARNIRLIEVAASLTADTAEELEEKSKDDVEVFNLWKDRFETNNVKLVRIPYTTTEIDREKILREANI